MASATPSTQGEAAKGFVKIELSYLKLSDNALAALAHLRSHQRPRSTTSALSWSELQKALGCDPEGNRSTARRALADLEAAGLISNRKSIDGRVVVDVVAHDEAAAYEVITRAELATLPKRLIRWILAVRWVMGRDGWTRDNAARIAAVACRKSAQTARTAIARMRDLGLIAVQKAATAKGRFWTIRALVARDMPSLVSAEARADVQHALGHVLRVAKPRQAGAHRRVAERIAAKLDAGVPAEVITSALVAEGKRDGEQAAWRYTERPEQGAVQVIDQAAAAWHADRKAALGDRPAWEAPEATAPKSPSRGRRAIFAAIAAATA